MLFSERSKFCNNSSQFPTKKDIIRNLPAFLKGRYKPSEGFSPRLLFSILVTYRVCEYPAKQLNPSLDFFDLISICGGLLQKTVSNRQEEMLKEDLHHSSL